MEPLSIVVPVLEEAGGIVPLLERLAPFRSRGVEVLVADGGSVDGTPELAAPLADRVVRARPGRARQMNAGARAARGGVLLFLHADTVLPAEADRLVLDGLAATGRAWGRFDVRLSGTAPALRMVETLMNLRSRWTGIATGDQAIFVRRDVFEQVGGYPDMPLMEDVALSAALRRVSPPLCLRERVVTSSRRWETRGIARTIVEMWRLRAAFALGASPWRLARAYYPHLFDRLAAERVLVFAKEPVPGRVKTRLAPPLSPEEAAALHAGLVLDTVERMLPPWPDGAPRVELHVAGDVGHPLFAAIAERGVDLLPQRGADLGERMAAALDRALGKVERAVLVGTDCPALSADHVARALARLAGGADVVLVPATDGGYVLVGARREARDPLPGIFAGVPWGTDRVLEATRERCDARGLALAELEPLPDLDRPEDLAALEEERRAALLARGRPFVRDA